MPRGQTPDPLTREELVILVKHHLERAGSTGLTMQELLAAIGLTRTSPRTLRRALDDLRSKYDAILTSTGKIRRWRLESRGALSLDAPNPEDLVAVIHAIAVAKPLLPPEQGDRLVSIAEALDERVRAYAAASELPHHNALTSSFTRSMKTDDAVVSQLFLACRRKTVRIFYKSPWRKSREVVAHDIEPWALDMHDASYYMRAWALGTNDARTFSVAHISAVEIVEDAPRRHPVPAKPWAEEGAGYGIDKDRPGIAVIRMRGGVARWVSTVTWHPDQKDVWLEDEELLERTIAYNSCREFARLLATVIDGIESIAPLELEDEVLVYWAHAERLRRNRDRSSEPV